MLKKTITLFLSALLLISTFTSCAKADTDQQTAEKFIQALFTFPNQTITNGFEELKKEVDKSINGEEVSKGADEVLKDAFTEVFEDITVKVSISARFKNGKIDYFRVSDKELFNLFMDKDIINK